MKPFILKSIVACSMLATSLSATTVRDAVEQTINTNPDIVAEHFRKKANKLNIQEQEKDYYPKIDFTAFIEKSRTENDPENPPTPVRKGNATKDGWDMALKFEQLLYDGGLTPNEIMQYKYKYASVKYESKEKVEDLIMQIVNTYTTMVASQEIIALDNLKLKTHKKYLELAKEDEKNGKEILPVYQVSSKIKGIVNNFIDQEIRNEKAFSTYKKLTGQEIKGNICRPIIDESKIPKTVEDAIDIALRKNNKIKAQQESIKEQASRQDAQNAKFRPDLKLQAQAKWDDDLSLPENGRQDIYNIKLVSNWNLYNGGKDDVATQKEKIFLLERKKVLDSISNDIVDNVKGSYNAYFKTKEKIANLKELVKDNQEILRIYTEQRKDGSRTFIDVLDAETELFRILIMLNDAEFALYDEYYRLLKGLSILSDTLLEQKTQVCEKFKLDTSFIDQFEDKEETSAEMEERLLGIE